MTNAVYKVIDVVGSSPTSIEDAIECAISRTAQTVHNIGWFEVTETRGHIVGGKIAHYQVHVKLGFTLDD